MGEIQVEIFLWEAAEKWLANLTVAALLPHDSDWEVNT